MTTKEQERKALEKIRKIVLELGEDSYVGTAFTGVFSIAEQNIEYDAAFSLAEEVETARQSEKAAKAALEDMKAQVRQATQEQEKATQETAYYKSIVGGYRDHADEVSSQLATANDLNREMSKAYETLELDNMKLKAKLYDMMTVVA